MATATRQITRADHGERMAFAEFVDADFEGGHFLYELARGVIVVTEIPGINHGRIVMRLARLFMHYDDAHPGVINYQGGGSECRIRLPGMASDRHPDQAIYLLPPPRERKPWMVWVPSIVVEIVSAGGEERDYVEKREEYLRAGVLEYWIIDPGTPQMKVHQRAGDTWIEAVVAAEAVHATHLLPGLEVRPGDLLGPVAES
jgi:Uma2 family endonuclease